MSPPPWVQQSNPAAVALVPALRSSVTLVYTMAALCSPSELYSPLSLGDNEGLLPPRGQAEQRADLLAGAFLL